MRKTESTSPESHSSSTDATHDVMETNTWGFYTQGVRIETMVMLLFSFAIFGAFAYVAYRRWNRNRYYQMGVSRYDPDYYDRGGGRTSWLVNPHQVGAARSDSRR